MALTISEAQAVQDLVRFLQGGAWDDPRPEGWEERLRERAANALVTLSGRSAKALGAGRSLDVDEATAALGVLGPASIAHVFPMPASELTDEAIQRAIARAMKLGENRSQAEHERRYGGTRDPHVAALRRVECAIGYLNFEASVSLRDGFLGQARIAAAAAGECETIRLRSRPARRRAPGPRHLHHRCDARVDVPCRWGDPVTRQSAATGADGRSNGLPWWHLALVLGALVVSVALAHVVRTGPQFGGNRSTEGGIGRCQPVPRGASRIARACGVDGEQSAQLLCSQGSCG
ncbi:hypothetical protein [Miniimonas arenae]|uniref:hypothetical protein n=1 Tax=Miniimonas arenae TaxID=676201 RepID=UPI0028A9C359|nr:hypothetical protein [Miniimonas arenae]